VAGNGPAPKPDAQRRRRNATVAMTKLPAEGRPGPAPAWPLGKLSAVEKDQVTAKAKMRQARRILDDPERSLSDRSSAQGRYDDAETALSVANVESRRLAAAERALWRRLWRLPQAVAWEREKYDREVAQYVRWKTLAEAGDLHASKEARMLADRLGLNPAALLRLRWEVVADELGAARQERAAAAAPVRATRRFKVVDGDAVAGA
jgi:hypothetical protein